MFLDFFVKKCVLSLIYPFSRGTFFCQVYDFLTGYPFLSNCFGNLWIFLLLVVKKNQIFVCYQLGITQYS